MEYKITKYEQTGDSLFINIISKNNPVYLSHWFSAEEQSSENNILETIKKLVAELEIIDEAYTPPLETISRLTETKTLLIPSEDILLKKQELIKEREVTRIDIPPSFNSLFENRVEGEFIYDSTANTLTKQYTIEPLSFEEALTKCMIFMDSKREQFEISGFDYNYNGLDVLIMTDKESSQPKLTASTIAARNFKRKDTDLYKFIKKDDNSVLVFPLTNEEITQIGDFVFETIQNSFNLLGQTAWQMLGAGNYTTLKEQVENGTINLNPWNV